MAAARFPTVSCKIGLQLKPKLYPNFPNMPSLFPLCVGTAAIQLKNLHSTQVLYLLWQSNFDSQTDWQTEEEREPGSGQKIFSKVLWLWWLPTTTTTTTTL